MRRRQKAAFYTDVNLRVALLAFVTAFLLILFLRIESVYESSLIYGLTLAFSVLCLVPFSLPRNRRLDILEPVYAIPAVYFIVYGLPVILNVYSPQYNLLGEDEYVAAALMVSIMALLSFFFGYFNGGISKAVTRRLPTIFLGWDGSRVRLAILALCGLGWLARLYRIYYYGLFFNDVIGLVEEVSLLSGVVSQLASLTRLGLVLLSVFAVYRDPERHVGRVWIVLLALMLSAEVLYFAFQGVKGGIVVTLLIPFVAYHYLRGRLGPKLLLLALVVVLVFPIVSRYRMLASISGNPLEPTVSITSSFSRFHDAIADTFSAEESFLDFFASSIQMAGSRISHLNILSTVISQMPEAVEYQYGKTFLVVVNAFIPRFIWAERPKEVFSNEFARQFGFNPLDLVSVTNFSMIEELYINFHVIGVALGMFMLGILLRTAYNYLIIVDRLSPLKVVIYVLIIQLLFGLFDLPLSSTLMSLPREMAVLAFVLFFIARSTGRLRVSPRERSTLHRHDLGSSRSI